MPDALSYEDRRAAEIAAALKLQEDLEIRMHVVAREIGATMIPAPRERDERPVDFSNGQHCILRFPDGAQIGVGSNQYDTKGRIAFHDATRVSDEPCARYIDARDYDRITVAVVAEAKRIAGELQRRFIPKWRAAVAKARETHDKEAAYERRVRSEIAEVCRLLDAKPPHNAGSQRVYGSGIDCYVSGHGTVRIEHLDLPIEALADLRKLVEKHQKDDA